MQLMQHLFYSLGEVSKHLKTTLCHKLLRKLFYTVLLN